MSVALAAGRAASPGFEVFLPPGSLVGSPLAAVPGSRTADSPAEAVALALSGAGLPNPPAAAAPR